jgi:hypothetical protein
MTSADSLVHDYLARLESGLAGVPRAGRREVLDEIGSHIAEARAELPEDDELGVRNVLDRLGDPSEIAAEARERFGVRRVSTTWREVGALILLPVPGLGWLAGVILLWTSDVWSRRDKVIGTLLIPAGELGAMRLLFEGRITGVTFCNGNGIGSMHCSGGNIHAWPTVLLVLSLAAAVGTEVYLLWRLRRRVRGPENENGAVGAAFVGEGGWF